MSNSFGQSGKIKERLDNNQCPRCLCELPPVEVHGHVQCATCNLYIQECCQGEQVNQKDT
jgi:hypothetical protein